MCIVPEKKWTAVADWKFLPFAVPHDGVPNFAYIVQTSGHRLLYMTDFEYCPFTVKKLNIDTFLIECNYCGDLERFENEGKYEHVLRGHSSLETVKGFIQANMTDSLKNIILCHLSSSNSDEGQMLSEITAMVPETVNVTIATKGKGQCL